MSAHFDRLTPMLNVRDIAASTAWFESVGFRVLDTVEDEGVTNWALLARDEVRVMLNLRPLPEGSAAGANLYFHVRDVDALWDEIQGMATVCEPLGDRFYGCLLYTSDAADE